MDYAPSIGALIQGAGKLGMDIMVNGPRVRQQAEEQAALRNAQTYSANMAGNKYGSEAAGHQFTIDQRQGVDDFLAQHPDMEPFRRAQMMAYKFAGPQYMDNFAKAGEIEQKTSAIQAIQQSPELATSYGKAFAATSGKAPFAAVGNTGRFINELTGKGGVSESTLAKIFNDDKIAQTAKSYSGVAVDQAQIRKLNADTAKVQAGAPSVVGYDQQGNPITDVPDPKLTEMQGKATLFASRMRDATTVLNELEGKVHPMQTAMAGTTAGNIVASPDSQQYRQAQENWVTANLRQESGAAIPPKEMEQEIRKWFPRVGDNAGVIKQKAASRKVAEEGMTTLSGPGRRMIERNLVNAGSAAAKSNPTSAGARKVVRTGMYNGRPVVQYEDGTVEYKQ